MKIPRAKMEIEGGHAEARVLYLEARVGGPRPDEQMRLWRYGSLNVSKLRNTLLGPVST